MRKLVKIDGEQWRDVPRFSGYAVSDLGRCKRTGPTGEFELQGKRDRLGYQQFGLVREPGKQEWFLAHRLIASVFLNPQPVQDGQFMTVNHKNRVRDDNRVDNLELVTVAENHRHWRRHQLHQITA